MLGIPAGLSDVDLTAELAALGTAMSNWSPTMVLAAGGLVWPFLKPMLIGTLPIGVAVASAFYVLSKRAALAHRERRRPISPFRGDYPLGDLLATYDPAH